MSNILNLPKRVGAKPDTSHGIPHSQLNQHGPDETIDQLRDWAFGLPDIENHHSQISVPGARAMVLCDGTSCNAEAFMIGREFAHIHPYPDNGSMHLKLEHDDALAVIESGFGEHHTLVLSGHRPVGLVMVFSPRDAQEQEIVKTIITRSYDYATGKDIAAHSPN
ncbi:luciferase family protein [Roseovarius sp. EL26]|uniref:luciferase domain-containing protein n=1 Tax=Roseovarius sp. EL26 TaxID=2126672 RepID=UPI000EA13948|nr:luciferase family protein [Roseovarius sp. EL26]